MRPRLGSYKKSDVSKKQVVEAAIKTLAKQGFANTSVQDIAAIAGMSKGVVHYHFDSKDDLIAHVLKRCADTMSERVRAAWEEPGTAPDKIRRALREMWSTRTDGSPEMRVLADLMAQAVHDPKLKKPLAAMFQLAREELVAEMVQAFKDIGLKPRLPPHVIPRLMMATLDGLGLHHIFDPPTEHEEKELARALEVLAFSMFEL
jgi:AcrR family transcriptional regulator